MVMDEALAVTLRVVRALEGIGVPYLVGGSIASSFYGEPRATQDVDIVADLQEPNVSQLVAALRDDFYLDEPAIREAVRHRSTFNVIHLETMFKVDIFVAKDDVATLQEFERRRLHPLPNHPDTEIVVATPEDIVVQKLYWYRLGGEVSDRQWLDALKVLEVRLDSLELPYMHQLARHLGVEDLLERVLTQARSQQ
jgi:hypothetical protein